MRSLHHHRVDDLASDTPCFALQEVLGSAFPGFVARLRGRRFHVPLRPTADFVELCGKEIARALLLNFPGEAVRVPTTELFDPRILRRKVLSVYASGATVGEISSALGIGSRSVSDILSGLAGSTDFRSAQQARIIALVKRGHTIAHIAARSRATAEQVCQTIAKSRQALNCAGVIRPDRQQPRKVLPAEKRPLVRDLYVSGQFLRDIATQVGVSEAVIRREISRLEASGQLVLADRRFRALWGFGLDDIDIALECQKPLSEVHAVLKRNGVRFDASGVPLPNANTNKSNGHLTRAMAGSDGRPPHSFPPSTFAAPAAS